MALLIMEAISQVGAGFRKRVLNLCQIFIVSVYRISIFTFKTKTPKNYSFQMSNFVVTYSYLKKGAVI